MKHFTDLFIRRPVLAMVVSLFILVLGLRSLVSLPVQQYPHLENAVVTVTTVYYGASNETVAGFITTPLENAIAQANGIDYMTSSSADGVSQITVNLQLNYDADKALTEISAKVDSVLNQLPAETQKPTITTAIGQTVDAMYLGFRSDVLDANQITDYLVRVVQPRLQAVPGVQTAEFLGARNFALRAWLDPQKMAALNVTAADVAQAMRSNDAITGLGSTKGQMVQINLTSSTNLTTLNQFRALIIKQQGGAIVRLKDVANVTLGADDYNSAVTFDGKEAVFIGIQIAPSANLLDVVDAVRKATPDIFAQMPRGLHGRIVYDSTIFVHGAIAEVIRTLAEALVIVMLVVFAFIGSPRAVIIPVVAIPLSLVGTFTLMLAFGFSINLLTLLALVLAIGLVVDDAIIVVENVNRHLEEGKKPLQAALLGAAELGSAIIAMTAVLVAVYLPIGFQSGLTGTLFTEFAFTLAGAVVVSGVVALTLSPMMCAKLLKAQSEERQGWDERLTAFIDRRFERLRLRYEHWLAGSLDYRPVTYVFAALVLGSIFVLYTHTSHELAPQEDMGALFTMGIPSSDATVFQRHRDTALLYKKALEFPEVEHAFQFDIPHMSMSGLILSPWNERKRTSNQLQPLVQNVMNTIAGQKVAVFQLPPLPGSSGLPIQFAIGGGTSLQQLNDVSQAFLQRMEKTGLMVFVESDLKLDRPQDRIVINRDKAAQMGLTMAQIGNGLAAMLGGGYINYFDLSGRSYKVIPQVLQRYRLNSDQLLNYHLTTGNGTSVPLSTVATIKHEVVAQTIKHFQQANAATIQGVPMPGISMGEVLQKMREIAADVLPPGYSVDYGGASRQFMQESSGFVTTFAFALIIIFLALAALFESFRDPLIILVSVPMSIAGALIFINLFSDFGVVGSTINIYTQVGLVTLMGLISKHGILIVDFANDAQRQGKTKLQAVQEAAGIRLRPILMTTAAMVLGTLPLVFASGAGAVSRFSMGLCITAGLSIGTLFTLFVVPAVYMLVASDHHAQDADGAA
ncbi:MAG: multidrug efflux protein [Nevskiaceae bacterium]|nr:MAG: multidrug efflux protein [Nevskiaceae bacterium]TBR71951.1 MAG: multidrug efflux protein [Nevskiaceae bacterium]